MICTLKVRRFQGAYHIFSSFFKYFFKDAVHEVFKLYKEYSDREEIAPEVIIKLIAERVCGDGLSVAYNACEYTDDIVIGYAVLLYRTVIAADNVIVLAHLQNSVQNVQSVGTNVERNVIFFESAARTLDYHNVSALAKQWHHTRADVGVNNLAVQL